MRAVLALDQGSHASRACVFDAEGILRADASVPVGTVTAAGGRVEQDADELAVSLIQAADRALAKVPGATIEASGLATQRSTIVCFRRPRGPALGPALSWMDRRAADWLEAFEPHAARVRAVTGLPLSPHYGASKLRWCLDHRPDVAAARAAGELCAAPLAAWLVARLTGLAPRVDPANASRTMLFDSARLDWSPELLALFGIERAWLPELAATHDRYGPLELASLCVPLNAVTGDQSAVPWCGGSPDAEAVYVNLGTGAFIQRPLRQRPAAPEPLVGSVLAAGSDGALWSLEGTVNGAGAATAAFAGDAGLDEAGLWAALTSIPPEAALPVFVNGVGGLGSPWWAPAFVSRFVGKATPLLRFAAVVESIAFLIAANHRAMIRERAAAARVYVTGGLCRSDFLCERLAALLGVPVQRLPAEATARGVAALAAPDLSRAWKLEAGREFAPREWPGLAEREARFLAEIDASL